MTTMRDFDPPAHYVVYHYNGKRVDDCETIDGAIARCECGREPGDRGRHCVVRNGCVVYWSASTDRMDRSIVRRDFLRDGILTSTVDLIERESSDEIIPDSEQIDDERERIRMGLREFLRERKRLQQNATTS